MSFSIFFQSHIFMTTKTAILFATVQLPKDIPPSISICSELPILCPTKALWHILPYPARHWVAKGRYLPRLTSFVLAPGNLISTKSDVSLHPYFSCVTYIHTYIFVFHFNTFLRFQTNSDSTTSFFLFDYKHSDIHPFS